MKQKEFFGNCGGIHLYVRKGDNNKVTDYEH